MANPKSETLNSKQVQISNVQSGHVYDLEDRTYKFAKECREYVASLQKNLQSIEDAKQLIRSSGSVAANYIEANEALSKRDFIMRIKIARKESKESILWLKLIDGDRSNLTLIVEATELMKIFGAIIEKSK